MNESEKDKPFLYNFADSLGGNVVWYFVTLLYDSINNSMAWNILTPTLTNNSTQRSKEGHDEGVKARQYQSLVVHYDLFTMWR